MGIKDTTVYKKMERFFVKNAPRKEILDRYYTEQSGSNPYQRQAADIRTKEIEDWQMALMAATDPASPNRGPLYHVYENLLRDEQLQSCVENRVLSLQQSVFSIKNKAGQEQSKAKKLLERPWHMDLQALMVKSHLQGPTVVDLTKKMKDETMEIDQVEEVPQCNICAPAGVILFKEGDSEGTSYRQDGLSNYYMQFGKDWSMGMLNELAIIIFAKKLGMGSWINYIDLYGVPALFAITGRMDATRRDELYRMLEDFRSCRFGVLHTQEKIEMGHEASASTSSAFEPYIKTCHDLIARRVLGQTGTTSNEAYEGTARLHQAIEKLRLNADKILYKYYFETEIIPRLVKISPVYSCLEGCTLEWNDRETLSLKDFIEAISKLSYTFDFDPVQVSEITGLPITGIKEITNQGTEGETNDPPSGGPVDPSKKKAETGKVSSSIRRLYYPLGGAPVSGNSFTFSKKIRDRVLKRLREKGINDIDPDLFEHTFTALEKAAEKGYGKTEFGTPDHDFLNALKYNNAVFSAFKTHLQQKELHQNLFDEEGNMKSFDRFRRDTEQIISDYNVNWLRTEYDTAIHRARTAADFRQFEKDTDLYPNLKWLPSVSPHPRELHRQFYGVIRAADDPWWKENYPGNLWNCKCGITNTDEPVTTGPIRPVRIIPAKGLDENPAFSKKCFSESHPYFGAARRDKQLRPKVERFVKAYLEKQKVDTARSRYESHDEKQWRKDYFNEKNGGFLVTQKKRISDAEKSKNELEKFKKEHAMAKVFGKAGFEIEHLAETARMSSSDVRINGIPADLKRTSSANNIVKYGKKAVKKQGAKAVLFQIDGNQGKVHEELNKLARLGIKAYYFFTGKENEIHSN